MKKLTKELLDYPNRVNTQLDNHRTRKLDESIQALSFTFASEEEKAVFHQNRLKTVNVLGKPGIKWVYLDYGKPTQVRLAQYILSDNLELGQGRLLDKYYEANS